MANVKHRHVWKPVHGGGHCLTTLCGRVDNSGDDYNMADNDDAVTCKLCRPLLSGQRRNYNSKWLGYTPSQ